MADRAEVAKAYLGRVRAIKDDLEELEQDYEGQKALRYEPVKGKRGFEEKLVRERSLLEKIDATEERLDRTRAEISSNIGRIKDPMVRNVLHKTFMEGKNATEVGMELSITPRQVRRCKERGYQMIPLPKKWERLVK